MSSQPILEFKDLCFSYSGVEILHGINISIGRGDFVAVIGPNGGGKTTLIKLAVGLLRPTRGQVLLHGFPAQETPVRIGYVPQQINHNILFPATALDIVLTGKYRKNSRFQLRFKEKDRQDGLEALKLMGMADLAKQKITALSGGQRQRVFIARALVSDPEILIMDEPTASLDTKGQQEFYQLLETLNKRLTIFMVSHDLMTISTYAKSIACVNKYLHYHQMFASSTDLLSAFYSCSVYESCPVDSISQRLQERAPEKEVVDA